MEITITENLMYCSNVAEKFSARLIYFASLQKRRRKFTFLVFQRISKVQYISQRIHAIALRWHFHMLFFCEKQWNCLPKFKHSVVFIIDKTKKKKKTFPKGNPRVVPTRTTWIVEIYHHREFRPITRTCQSVPSKKLHEQRESGQVSP